MLYRLIGLAVVVGVLAWFLRPRPAFRIVVRGGEPVVTHGKVPQPFVDDCGSICSDLHLTRATIRGFDSGNGIRLRFSRQISGAHEQRFRNAWHVRAR